MRQLLPRPADCADPYDAYAPADPREPLLRLNMVASVDGSVVDRRGRSGGLAGPGDREIFRALRAHADAILVGAGTVRAEGYGPHRLSDALAARRARDGRSAPAAVVVVTRSLDLDLDAPLFTEASTATVILTCAASPRDRRALAGRSARVVVTGDEQVDLAAGVAALRSELGLAHVVCEGGPSLNAQLLDGGLVDEVCVTVAPLLVGTRGPGLTAGMTVSADLALASALEHDGELYLRYRVG